MIRRFLTGVVFCLVSANIASAWDAKNVHKQSPAELKKNLNKQQYKVAVEAGTESPFNNEYWNEKREGIYVDIASGQPLFSSLDKYDSGTGWPSFSQPIAADAITKKSDRSFFSERTEVRSSFQDLHLGHVFEDGPKPTGLRYCMNSAAMRFIPKEDLANGYSEYLALFAALPAKQHAAAVFAGGCFWCMQPPFDALKNEGVIATEVGYAGGEEKSATYSQVSAGGTGHREVVQVIYDPTRVNYARLLEIFLENIDPLNDQGQFCDNGEQYTPAIYAISEEERKQALAAWAAAASKIRDKAFGAKPSGGKTGLPELPVYVGRKFYPAEDYHQNYYQKNPKRYAFYRYSCGRDARLKAVWGHLPSFKRVEQ